MTEMGSYTAIVTFIAQCIYIAHDFKPFYCVHFQPMQKSLPISA